MTTATATDKPAYAYIRVSTIGQIEGVSLDAQRDRAEKWASANGYRIDGLFCDAGISGKRTTNRPELQRALAEVCKVKGCALIVYSLSRLARSTRDAINLAEQLSMAECDLVSLTEKLDTTSATGKLMFRVLAVLAEFERDLISERTTTALAHKAARGEVCGQVPFGRRRGADGAHLEDDPDEREVIAEIARLRESGRSCGERSWRAIAESLNARGITTKMGRCWNSQLTRNVGLAHAIVTKASPT